MRLLTSLLTFAAAASMPVASEAELIINELMQSNIDCIMDDLDRKSTRLNSSHRS